MTPRRSSDLKTLTDEQRELLRRGKRAAAKARKTTAADKAALAERDQLVRDLIEAEVGVTLVARELGMNRAMVWKVERKLTTASLERRSRKRDDE